MSVSRRLGPAVQRIARLPRDTWKLEIGKLPEACPHPDCTVKDGCRDFVARYFRVQWHTSAQREAEQRAKGIRGQG